jgi:hypothetical protein
MAFGVGVLRNLSGKRRAFARRIRKEKNIYEY